jgi:hypothetical protein
VIGGATPALSQKHSQDVADLTVQTVTRNSTTRGWCSNRIAVEVSPKIAPTSVSASTVYRVLKANGFPPYKRTVKPGVKQEDKARRLDWCRAHENWTLEVWKNVVWTDETSVQLGSVRGKRRVWGER